MRFGMMSVREGVAAKMEEFDRFRKKRAREQYTPKNKCPFVK